MIQDDEILDIVDESDCVVGQKKRSEIYRQGLCNFRVVNAFVVNSLGQLWIPRRSAHKTIFPLCLDVSMGGHVETGETYEDALQRELKEELNLELNMVNVRPLGHLIPYQYQVSGCTTKNPNTQDLIAQSSKDSQLVRAFTTQLIPTKWA
ncbi:NUDIX domain-containing protein [Nostoc sp. WHI]|uniref:NUDIX domain-containing protein n=1 Tax=Nostoc sp. WHI TaxID=2650611 RepID=UPI0018C6B848|nr:NUDIX domain-containing protein [Nostoc sp. WHI]MBG1268388.1 NUDIX domain-containing protein [Nostoc sp. WHI]